MIALLTSQPGSPSLGDVYPGIQNGSVGKALLLFKTFAEYSTAPQS